MKQILTLCDRDKAKGNDVEAPDEPFRFSIDGNGFELDACAGCQDEFFELIDDYITVARRVDGKSKPPGNRSHHSTGVRPQTSCPYCGIPQSLGTGIKRHIGATHPERYAEYLAEHPNKKPSKRKVAS